MTKKFTEEQYQKIVDIAERWKNNRERKTKEILEYIFDSNLIEFGDSYRLDEVLAIANPLTREWAHDKFVEKEKTYYWKLNELYLERDTSDGSILFNVTRSSLTESEIREWGFNPEMFDREEV